MNIGDFFYLGKVVKTHGIDGALCGFFDTDDPLRYSDLHAVFINTKLGLLPYSFEDISVNSNGYCIFRLKEIDTIEKAKRFLKKEMYLPLSMLPPLTGNDFYYHEIIGFSVVDQDHGHIGTIDGVIEQAVQPLFQIIFQEKEILIPVHNDFIIEVNREKKTIFIKTPDGLIGVYLQS